MRRTFGAVGNAPAIVQTLTDTTATFAVTHSIQSPDSPGSTRSIRVVLTGAQSGVTQVRGEVKEPRIDTSARVAKVNAMVSLCTIDAPLDQGRAQLGDAGWSTAIGPSIADTDRAATQQRLASYRSLLADVWPCFPNEPAGVGATWHQESHRLVRDAVAQVHTEWTLSGREGDSLTLSLARTIVVPAPDKSTPALRFEQHGTVNVNLRDPRSLTASLDESMSPVVTSAPGDAAGPGGAGSAIDLSMTSESTVTVTTRVPAPAPAPTSSGSR